MITKPVFIISSTTGSVLFYVWNISIHFLKVKSLQMILIKYLNHQINLEQSFGYLQVDVNSSRVCEWQTFKAFQNLPCTPKCVKWRLNWNEVELITAILKWPVLLLPCPLLKTHCEVPQHPRVQPGFLGGKKGKADGSEGREDTCIYRHVTAPAANAGGRESQLGSGGQVSAQAFQQENKITLVL